uniref:Putative mitochondrial intermembrane space import and assembly protein 40 n=1 Tax=Ornithodoros turicata TaxID=34597 RepID=A0A2R5LMM2_9ACAR
MSYCKSYGKDKVIFVTREDHEKPSTIKLPDDPEDDRPGLILPNGDINWNCPCLGGMAAGPCGAQFREAFSCFHYSTSETKGSECFEHFRSMQDCMAQYPNLYPMDKDEDDDSASKQETLSVSDAQSSQTGTTQEENTAAHSVEDKRVVSN